MFNIKQSQTEAVDNTLMELAKNNSKIVALTADMADRIIPKFSRNYKDRFFNLGIAEQNMMGAAAGLAKSGFIPFVTTLVVFLSMRACEQLRTDVAYSNANVKIIGTGGGLAYGTLGATHQGLEDISLLRSISNLTVIAPADYMETVMAVKASVEYEGPIYIRLGRGAVLTVHDKDTIKNFSIGKAINLKFGSDISIIATGTMVAKSLEAAEILSNSKISASVYSMHTIKPIDFETVLEASKAKFGIITVEDNNLCGGLGEAVCRIVCSKQPVKVTCIGIPDIYPVVGDPEDLYKYYNMNSESIYRTALKMAGEEI